MHISNWRAIGSHPHIISPTVASILRYMADRADKDHGECRLQIATFVQDTKYSDRTVENVLRACEDAGYFTVLTRPVGLYRAGRWRLHYEAGGPLVSPEKSPKSGTKTTTRSNAQSGRKNAPKAAEQSAAGGDEKREGVSLFDGENPTEKEEGVSSCGEGDSEKREAVSPEKGSSFPNPASSPYVLRSTTLEVLSEVQDVQKEFISERASESTSGSTSRALAHSPGEDFSDFNILQNCILELWDLTAQFVSDRDRHELDRATRWLVGIEASPDDVRRWFARWDKARRPYLSQLCESEWQRLLPDWVSPIRRREAAARAAAEQERRNREEAARAEEARRVEAENAVLDAQIEAMGDEERAALDRAALGRYSFLMGSRALHPPESVMRENRRSLIRTGWTYDPEAAPEPTPLAEHGRGLDAPRPDAGERSQWSEVPATSPQEYLRRMREKIAAGACSDPDIVAAVQQSPEERRENLKRGAYAA